MRKIDILFAFFLLITGACLPAQDVDDSTLTAEEVITKLYNLVTFDAGTTPDWDKVRALFLPEVVIVLRTCLPALASKLQQREKRNSLVELLCSSFDRCGSSYRQEYRFIGAPCSLLLTFKYLLQELPR